MATWRDTFLVALLGLCAAGCATRNDMLKLDVPVEQKAVVYGIAENKGLVGIERALSFTAIDGVSTYRGYGRGYPVSVELLPGRRTVTVLYRITDQGGPGPTGELTKELTVVGGRTYESDLFEEDGHWDVRFREVSDTEMQQREAERAARRQELFDS